MFYIAVLSVFFGAIGMPTLRMKYLWTPCMCIPGILGINDYKFWRTIILSPLKTGSHNKSKMQGLQQH